MTPLGDGRFFGYSGLLRECLEGTEVSFMLREERGMAFAVGAMMRGLEVGGRWERIGVESAHEWRWKAEVEAAEALFNTTRIAQIVVGPERKK